MGLMPLGKKLSRFVAQQEAGGDEDQDHHNSAEEDNQREVGSFGIFAIVGGGGWLCHTQ